MSTVAELPRWDLDPLFPGLESEKFQRAWAELERQLGELKALYDQHQIGARPARPTDREVFETLIERINTFGETLTPLFNYLIMRVDTDSSDTASQAKLSELELRFVEFQKLNPRFVAWLAGLEPSAVGAGEYSILLEEAKVLARHQMSEAEEALAAELSLSGSRGWVKLHSNLTSQIMVRLADKELPMPAVRNLANSPDASLRQAAYEAELAAWKAHEIPLAAALNGYKGEVSTLNRKRGWEDDIAPSLVENRITRETLEAMQAAMVASFPEWRRYFAAKARALGKTRLEWWDLSAPVGKGERSWSWEEGRRFILEHLAGFSPADAELAQRAYAERWIDAPPRRGKVGGAYCASVGGGVSRILTNWEDSFDAVSTMAHELGHAYHNHCLRGVPYLLRSEPMTLAETASIMNETVVVEAALAALPESEGLVVLEASLQGAAQVIVDIHSRFLFERSVFAQRRTRELSPEEFCELMVQAQDATYGEGLASRHPYMWAVKGHYYGSNFYNYPYAFGQLFGLALYRRYQQEGPAFVARYDDLLASVGKFPAGELAARFGFDLETEAFWQGGIALLVERINRFEALIQKATS